MTWGWRGQGTSCHWLTALFLCCGPSAARAATDEAATCSPQQAALQVLRPGEAHFTDDFLSVQELNRFAAILATGKAQKVKTYGSAYNQVHPLANDTDYLWSVMQRIRDYAEAYITSQSVLEGPWKYRDRYYPDLFTLRRYGAMSPMKVHMDTGTYARCLSAALHVGSPASSNVDRQQGGALELYKCNGTCRAWHGWQAVRQEQPPEDLRESEPLVKNMEVQYAPGRLVLFLAETPHGVTAVSQGGERDVMFVWFSCEATLKSGAVSSGHIQLVESLLAAHASVHDTALQGQKPIMQAAISGHVSMLDYLVSMRADLESADSRGLRPLHLASMWGQDSVVQHLLSLGVQSGVATAEGHKPLDVATLAGHASIVERLLPLDQHGDASSTQRLQVAIRAGHSHLVSLLLERRAVVNRDDFDGRKPLFWAAWTGYIPTVELLLAWRAEPDARSARGEHGKFKALQMAVEGGHLKTVKLLLQARASVSAAVRDGLPIAVARGHKAIRSLLLGLDAAA